MGIYYFYSWFKRNFRANIRKVYTRSYDNSPQTIKFLKTDVLLVDMNSILHDATQYVYRYGNYESSDHILDSNIEKKDLVHERVNEILDTLVTFVSPKKKVVLCVDGPAPFSKQSQQRKRRYKSSLEQSENIVFDSASITPGTIFMSEMCSNIDWFIRKKMSDDSASSWKDIEIVFSPANCPNEGETKIMNYIRKYGSRDETYCIHGNDSDLVMLSLLTHLPKIHILRDEITNHSYSLINIGKTHQDLEEILKWENEKGSKPVYFPLNGIEDFVFLCFVVGNDFLPHIPSLEILEYGIETIIETYKQVGSVYGHIVIRNHKEISYTRFRKDIFSEFLEQISVFEKPILESKLSRKEEYFENKLLERCLEINFENKPEINIEKYRKEYSFHHFQLEVDKASMSYIQGLDWVLNYYKHGTPCWDWSYSYDYAPSISDIILHIDSYKRSFYKRSKPMLPLQQLISVLPPKSSNLLPKSLQKIFSKDSAFKKKFCPEEPEIDLSGKKNKWEGVVILPKMSVQDVIKIYERYSDLLTEEESQTNFHMTTFNYYLDNKDPYSFVIKDKPRIEHCFVVRDTLKYVL